MELRPAAYVMKQGTNPSDAIPYKRGRNHARGQVPCLHNTYTVQKRFKVIKHRCSVKSLTSVLTHGHLHPTSVSVGHLISFITAFYTDRIFFLLSPRMLQSVRRHSAIVLTDTVNGMQEIHPVIYLLLKLNYN